MREYVSLNGDWTLQEALGHTDIPATVPGSVLLDLCNAGLIDDPFYRENEYTALRLFDRDYTYTRVFDAPLSLRLQERVDLVFEGLDTLGEVTLNGETVLVADNMHRTWRAEVRRLLEPAGNRLTVTLRSPNAYIAEASRQNPDVTYDGTGYTMGSNFLRKAHCMFGWDWGPQLPDAGIWRPCGLEGYSVARIAAVELLQAHAPGKVRLTVQATVEGEPPAYLRVTVADPQGHTLLRQSEGDLLVLEIDNPCLWQPNGWGEQPLYTVTVACLDRGFAVVDETTRRIGLRTVAISQQPDAWGTEFCFTVNGAKIFAMGADYIPEDNLIGRTSPARTRRLLEACVRANFNTVRVWGGGYYPEDWFFDLCDELGLLVWLDLMYACNVYKLTEAFERNVVAETRDNLRRVRHHACLCVICGNNEMESGWVDWPAVRDHSPALKADYIKLFEYVLKKECAALAPQIPYWPSSPSSGGGFDEPNAYHRGDVHYWDVWHGLKPFSDYRNQYPRFCSEFGFESFPCGKTVEAFTAPEDRNIYSRVMESHQKCVGGNGKIMYYISQNFRYPTTLAQVLYASQLQQAEAMRAGVEHWRRYRGRCMGAIYWQLNDCWPVASWASVDSFGRWKQLQYAARRFFAPVMVSCERKGMALRVNVVNDRLTAFAGTVEVWLINARGDRLKTWEAAVAVEPLTAEWVLEASAEDYAQGLHPEDQLVAMLRLRDEADNLVSENCELFSPTKFMAFVAPALRWQVAQAGDDCTVTLTADAFAWGVWLETGRTDCEFSDNGFVLLPGEARTVTAYGAMAGRLQEELTVTSIADIGR